MGNRSAKLLIPAMLCLWLDTTQAADIDVGGLLINQTRTLAGQEFYRAFTTVWQAYDPDSVYTLVVEEKAGLRNGSQIVVLAYDKPVYRSFINFNPRKAAERGQEAAGLVFGLVQGAQLDSLLGDPDLGAGELE